MTQLVVPIMVQSCDQALVHAQQAAQKGADWIELRIDCFTDHLDQLHKLIEYSPLPCIVTCRPTWEGGLYDGDEQTRISALEHAGLGGRKPVYIDLELVAYQRSANIRQKIGLVVNHADQHKATPTGLILSSHDFDSKPDDLDARVEAMNQAPACQGVKIVWKARSLNDNLIAFDVLQRTGKPAIALCMGAEGVPSRVLAKKFGALLTFAALDESTNTAPGQVTIDALKRRYRWDQLGPETSVYGVIGWPIGHSLSPAIHNAGFDTIGFDGVYLPLPIQPSYERFAAVMDAWIEAPDLDFRGASVTIPHKENLLRYVRQRGGHIEPLADRIGAANTLTRRQDGSLYVSNTDYAGALDAVCESLSIGRNDLAGRRVAVVGAGGAARAVAAGFASYGATVVVYNRTLEKAQKLADQLSQPDASDDLVGKIVGARLEKLCDSCCEIFINCTPIGMHPHTDATPIPQASPHKKWGSNTVVFDTVYNPLETRLLREARQAGCVTIRGVEMFVRQAALQFEQWTGQDAPIEVFRGVVLSSLKQSK